MNTTGIIDSRTISSTGAITGSSFQNTTGSSTISSTGLIGGSAIQIALNGSISVGGLAAITNGIHVVGEIRSTTGNFLATAGTITAGNGLIGAYQNTATSATASISTAGDILGISLSSGTGAITGGAITASGLILANGGLTVPSGQTFTNNGSFINTGAVTGAGLIVSGANNITLGTGTIKPVAGQIGFIQTTTFSPVSMQGSTFIKTVMSITLSQVFGLLLGQFHWDHQQILQKEH